MKCSVLVFSLALLVLSAHADTIYVPEDYQTIGEAINAASDGDSIIVGPGVYDPAPIVSYSPNYLTILGNGYIGYDRTTIIGGPEEEGKFDIRNVVGWEIGGFELVSGKKGINTYMVDSCYFHDLYAHDLTWDYADGVMVNGNNVRIERSIFADCPYAGIEIFYPPQTGHEFRHNTILDCPNGVLIRGQTPNLIIENSIIAYNGDGVEFVGVWTGTEHLNYNDLYGNGDHWSGCTPGPNNIYADPAFVGGTGAEQYMLMPWSSCIDAGDPASPLDPDGTIADIGCFYFDQSVPQGEVNIDLEPVNPPVVIPPQGGSFDFTAELACDSSNWALFDVWSELLLPDGQIMGPLILRQGIYMEAGDVTTRELEMFVSMWAMPGTYEYYGHTGEYPDVIETSDYFSFEKEAFDGVPPEGASARATLSGWDAEETIEFPVAGGNVVNRFEFSSAPNPFNPVTTLRFTLPASGHVTLTVYDLTGRTVATLLDRNLEMGTHSVRFDGSHLASGIYLAFLESGNYRSTERLLLVK